MQIFLHFIGSISWVINTICDSASRRINWP